MLEKISTRTSPTAVASRLMTVASGSSTVEALAKAEKKAASGHNTDAMLDLYDHEVAIVEPARAGETEGVL